MTIMTEREMLVFAAKAAGNGAYWSVSETVERRPVFVVVKGGRMGTMGYEERWAPEQDPRDAMHLAAITDLSVDFSVPGHVMIAGPCDIGLDMPYTIGNHGEKIEAACLGITRAAAAIGEQMP